MDDWALLALLKKEPDAMTTLFYRHKDYVYRLATGFACDRHLADDITQDVFLRLIRMRRGFSAKASFRTWIYRVTLNTSREFVRKAKRQARLHEGYQVEDEPASSPAWHGERALEAALANLPARQREAVVLRYFERLSVSEVAQVMKCREGTAKATLHHARRNLRKAIPLPAEGGTV